MHVRGAENFHIGEGDDDDMQVVAVGYSACNDERKDLALGARSERVHSCMDAQYTAQRVVFSIPGDMADAGAVGCHEPMPHDADLKLGYAIGWALRGRG